MSIGFIYQCVSHGLEDAEDCKRVPGSSYLGLVIDHLGFLALTNHLRYFVHHERDRVDPR
jgi:hypothetical protein